MDGKSSELEKFLKGINTDEVNITESLDWLWWHAVGSIRIFAHVLLYSAVTETVAEPETAVFCQNRGEPKPRFFGAKWIRFRFPTFVFIYGIKESRWAGSGEETEGAFKVFSVG